MNKLTRRSFISMLAAAGLGALIPTKQARAFQSGPMVPLANRITECQLLYAAEMSSRDVGLGSVDFGSVREGSPVPVYECGNGGLTFVRHEVPLSSDGHVFASYSSNAESGAQLSLWMGKALEEYIDYYDSSEIALIADTNGMSVYDGQDLVRICERTAEFDSSALDDIESIPPSVISSSVSLSSNILSGEFVDIEQAFIVGSGSTGLDPLSNGVYYQPPIVPTDYVYRATNGVDQGSYPICWAACLAYIYNYVHNMSYTAEQAADYNAGVGYRGGKEGEEIALYLRNLGLGSYWFTESQPTISTISSNINSDRLMVGGMYGYNASDVYLGKHAVVIMGASASTGIIGIHDSNGGDFYFVYPSTGTYTYKYWHHTGSYKVKMFSHIRRYD